MQLPQSSLRGGDSESQNLEPTKQPNGATSQITQLNTVTSMNTRTLGTQGMQSSELALGCMAMSGSYGPADRAESIATIHEAIERGITMLDTGDFYGSGHNELLINEAIKGKRDKVLLSVKFGTLRNAKGMMSGFDGRPASVKNFVLYSLVRLGVDVIDFYFPSRVDPNVPIEDTVGAIVELINEGKVRYLGLSEAGAASIRKAHAVHPVSALEIEYSLFSRDVEDEILPTIRELGIGMLAYGVMSRGLFGSKLDAATTFHPADWRKHFPRFQQESLKQNADLFDKLDAFAKTKSCTVPQLCIAWMLRQGNDIVPLLGTKRRSYLDENLAALNINLSDEDMRTLETLVPRGAVVGERYSSQGMMTLGK